MTVFIDVLGQYFSSPVIVPYSASLGADLQLQGVIVGLPFLGRLVGGILLPIVADMTSRKLVVFASVVGSAGAYALSAAASDLGLRALLAGRLIGGFFGQTLQLLIAFLTQLFISDMATLKVKITWLQGVNRGAPVLLAPVGGMLASYSLNMPFVCAAAISAAAIFVIVPNFRDVDEIRRLGATSDGPPPANGTASPAASTSPSPTEPERFTCAFGAQPPPNASPWADPALMLMAATYFCFGVALNSTFVALPLLLTLEKSFGCDSSDAVARVVGFTQIPYGLALLVMQTQGYLYLSVSRRVSDAACLAVAGVATVLSTAAFAFATVPWHLYALYAVNGAGIGLTFGAYINVPNAYAARYYAHALAQARAVPFPFLNMGNLLGPVLLPLLGANSHRLGWIAAGGMHVAVFVIIQVVVAWLTEATNRPEKVATRACDHLLPHHQNGARSKPSSRHVPAIETQS